MALKIKKPRSVRSLQTQNSNLFSHFDKLPVKETRERPSYLSFLTEDTSPLFIKAIKAARAYGFCITDELPTENTQWKVTSVGTSKFLFQNLIPGKQHSVKVSVAGSRGQLVYSNIATMFVQ
jgi:hypothetical protein